MCSNEVMKTANKMRSRNLWFLASLAFLFCIVPSDSTLEFLTEPFTRLVKANDGRVVLRCDASPPGAEIRWLYNGQPLHHNRWIKASGQKLTVHLGKIENCSRAFIHHMDSLSDAYFQCEIQHKEKVLVSAPAKLILAVLKPFNSQPDVHISALVGSTAVIPCDPPYSIPTVVTEFTFNDTTIKKSTGNKHLMESGDLQIFNVQHEDSGEYVCIANNPFLAEKVTSKRKVILHIEESLDPKSASFIRSPRSKISVAIGSNITLECAATGNPPPVITWRKHQGKLPHGRHEQIGGNLHIFAVRKGDEGHYLCEADNSIGKVESRSTDLEIQETPQIVRPLKNKSVSAGDNLTISCPVRGHPKPSLSWLHNGKEITSDHKKSVVTLHNVSHRHSGIYQCFASNELGTVYSSASVTVLSGNSSHNPDDDDYEDFDSDESSHRHKGKVHSDMDKNSDDKYATDKDHYNGGGYRKRPHKKKHSKGVKLIPPSKPEVTRLSNTSAMVRWTVGDEGLSINFFKVQYKEVGKQRTDWMTIDEDIASHIHSYAVTNLRTGASYRFRIAAVYANFDNKAGSVSTKFVLYKDAPMEKPSIGPLITYAKAASPSAITLHWKYNDVDSMVIEGFFIHYRATHTAGKYLKVTVLGSNTRSHIISHLLPDTGYDIKMQCFNNAGTSDFSNIYTSKTKASEITAARNRNGKSQEEEEMEITLTEPVSSKHSTGGIMMYVILGSVLCICFIVVLVAIALFLRRRQGASRNPGNMSVCEEAIKLGNGHISTNGYIPVNKINISVNPLSRLDVDSTDKTEDLEDMVSNNNEIIRLQTFRLETSVQGEPLLNDTQRESAMDENEESVISTSVDSEVNKESEANL